MERKEITELIKEHRFKIDNTGVRYYKGEHDILKHRIFYFNSDNELIEDKYRSNIKIPHQFHTELVDQKVQYLLSNPIEVEAVDERLQYYMEEYINEDFQRVLQQAVMGASNKGKEFIYTYLSEDGKLEFQAVDSFSIIDITDEYGNLEYIIRYYKINDDELKVELWDENNITYFIMKDNKIILDQSEEVNPRPHILLEDEKNYIDGGSIGRIPFFKLVNNDYETHDLKPIKALIDDYDLMSASLSNNLEDFQDAIYVVKGYQGDNLDALTRNLKTRKTIGVDEQGGIDVKTVDIPYEARKVKLELNKEAIYKFGMGFDSSQVGDGNITNVVIQSRYSLLDLKCNKIETHLKAVIRDIIDLIVQDINRRYGTSYTGRDVEFELVRSTMINENDVYINDKIEEETKTIQLGNILSVAGRLSDETVLEMICEVLDIDSQEEMEKLEGQDLEASAFDVSRLIDDEE